MTELISSALNFMRLSFDQSLAKLCEPVFHRRVIKVVADLDDQAADQCGSVEICRIGVAPVMPASAGGGLFLAFIERNRRADVDRNPVVPLVPDLPGLAGQRGQTAPAARAD